MYLKPQQSFTRLENDSRGFDLLKVGRIGGDLGGFYTIHYESAPSAINGVVARVRSVTRIVSPFNFKVESRISVDGGPGLILEQAGGAKKLMANHEDQNSCGAAFRVRAVHREFSAVCAEHGSDGHARWVC